MNQDFKVGKYRHYKGNEYQVLGVALHTETKDPLVVYQGLYDSEEFGPKPLWARSLSMFTETVTVDGKEIPRFAYIGE